MHYDPAMAYEISYIVQDGLRRMYGESEEHPDGESVIYYLTVYNEPTVQPKEPDDLDVEGLLKGIYHVADSRRRSRAATPRGCSCSPPASASRGSPTRRRMLAEDWGVAADTWSVTSWNELARDAVACRGVEPPAPLRAGPGALRHRQAQGGRGARSWR